MPPPSTASNSGISALSRTSALAGDLAQRHRLGARRTAAARVARAFATAERPLIERIPRAARRTTPEPACRFETARRTKIHRSRFGHAAVVSPPRARRLPGERRRRRHDTRARYGKRRPWRSLNPCKSRSMGRPRREKRPWRNCSPGAWASISSTPARCTARWHTKRCAPESIPATGRRSRDW